MMNRQGRLSLILIFLFHSSVFADVISENFSTAAKKDVSGTTAVWNIFYGSVHPGLQVSNYRVTGFPAVPVTNFDVGDGSDGAFQLATYANFGTVSGTLITVDASVKPALKVTSFQLDNGYTLTAVNGPLIIYSQSTVEINGTINCDGENGGAATGVTGGSGGLGKCGGQSGGNGGNIASSGLQGLPVSGTVTAGGGGVYNAASSGAGGGGGGAYAGNDGAGGTNSTPATNTGGTGGAGSTGANHEFTILNGSPGGGGGSGSSTEGGGGGGAGGGTVVIHAVGNVRISSTGLILARGGQGGAANTGGGGGGGGGGSVKIFTVGNLELDSGTDVDVTGGLSGNAVNANAGDGGTGSFGRTWLNSTSFSGSGTESHPSLLLQLGTIEYNTVLQQAVSLGYDTSSTTVIYNSVSTDVTSADISLEVAGSPDNFASVSTGWQPLSQLSNLNNNRYIKYKISLTNSNATTPTTISSVDINYNPNVPPPSPSPSGSHSFAVDNYKFSSGGCGSVKSVTSIGIDKKEGAGSLMLHVLLVNLFLFLPLALGFKLRKLSPKNVLVN